MGKDGKEGVTGQSTDGVRLADADPDPKRELAEDGVARRRPVLGVEPAHVVDVDDHDGDGVG